MSAEDQIPSSPQPDSDEEVEEVLLLRPDNPMLNEAQKTLQKELSEKFMRIDQEVREKEGSLRLQVSYREELGNSLYAAQQQLAVMQMQLEKLNADIDTSEKETVELQKESDQLNGELEDRKKEKDQGISDLQKARTEISNVKQVVRQVESYGEQLAGEIAINRRATYKGEEALKAMEQGKLKQDLLVDRLNEKIKNETEEIAQLDAQLSAQLEEFASAKATIRDAQEALEGVQAEKKQISQQLATNLVALQRRDEALQKVADAIRDMEEKEMALYSTEQGLKLSIRKEQDQDEAKMVLVSRNEQEMLSIQTQMSSIKAERERMAEQYSIMKRSLDTANQDKSRLETAISERKQEIETATQAIQRATKGIAALNDTILAKLNDDATVDRSVINTLRAARKVSRQVEERETEINNVRNEHARIQVDILNAKAHSNMLADRSEELRKGLEEAEKLVDQYETENRQRNGKIEKKQRFLDQLNREFEDKRSKLANIAGGAEEGEEAIAGPLEAKIKSLRRSIQEKVSDCSRLQKTWIQKQTELLCLEEELGNLRDQLDSLGAARALARQKKLRMEGELKTEKSESNSIEHEIRHLRFDIDKMNSAVARYQLRQESTESESKARQVEFSKSLLEKEERLKEMEDKVEEILKKKTQIMENLVEIERQGMLWARKIQLQKEMTDALDPNIGQAEVGAMLKEIHRMELRFSELKRLQEKKIVEIQRAIKKRSLLETKCEPRPMEQTTRPGLVGRSTLAPPSVGASMKVQKQLKQERKLAGLRSSLKSCTESIQQAEMQLQDLDREAKDKRDGLEALRQEVEYAEEVLRDRHDQLSALRGEREEAQPQEEGERRGDEEEG